MQFRRLIPFLLLFSGVVKASPLTLTPGSLLVQQLNFPPLGNVGQYTTAGERINTLLVTGTNDLPESMTVLNGQLFVSDGSGRVNIVDLSTGTATPRFNTSNVGLTGLGVLGDFLLTLNFNSRAVSVYSSAGILQRSIPLSTTPATFNWNGIASDGAVLYWGDFSSGRIYEYSVSGSFLGFIVPKGGGSISGLSHDPSNSSLWIGSGSTVYDIALDGSVLGQFAPGITANAGIALIPVSTPEPAFWPLLLPAIGVLVFSRKMLSIGI